LRACVAGWLSESAGGGRWCDGRRRYGGNRYRDGRRRCDNRCNQDEGVSECHCSSPLGLIRLMHDLRAAIPQTSPLARAAFATIRDRLIKIGARVIEHIARIRIRWDRRSGDCISPFGLDPIENTGLRCARARRRLLNSSDVTCSSGFMAAFVCNNRGRNACF